MVTVLKASVLQQSQTVSWGFSMVELYGKSARDLLDIKQRSCSVKCAAYRKQGACLPQPTYVTITAGAHLAFPPGPVYTCCFTDMCSCARLIYNTSSCK